eukprot:611600-Pleurochrysis_carterae.AAC.5
MVAAAGRELDRVDERAEADCAVARQASFSRCTLKPSCLQQALDVHGMLRAAAALSIHRNKRVAGFQSAAEGRARLDTGNNCRTEHGV